ncbi:hypothetical protein [Devosia naphthalenivorans]|uniref:hypothetical protein n=1 Tax=Devosia naphthalenivorans TaxID=2082392 RepID=UPI000D335D10|nr:hypothetical protein [Devosia naphthalenivorans]
MNKLTRRTEYITAGTTTIGLVNCTDRGFETFGPLDQYLATYPSLEAARKALFELHKAGQIEHGGAP